MHSFLINPERSASSEAMSEVTTLRDPIRRQAGDNARALVNQTEPGGWARRMCHLFPLKLTFKDQKVTALADGLVERSHSLLSLVHCTTFIRRLLSIDRKSTRDTGWQSAALDFRSAMSESNGMKFRPRQSMACCANCSVKAGDRSSRRSA
jgi:hypothetical protein